MTLRFGDLRPEFADGQPSKRPDPGTCCTCIAILQASGCLGGSNLITDINKTRWATDRMEEPSGA